MSDKEIKKAKKFNYTVFGIVIIFAVAFVLFLNRIGLFSEAYAVKITIPAGNTDAFVYSDEEFSSKDSKLTVTAGDGMGDGEIILKPTQENEENTYYPSYITPGLKVEIEVEKGAWFRIGVNRQNPTDEDIVVYLNVFDVEVRIE